MDMHGELKLIHTMIATLILSLYKGQSDRTYMLGLMEEMYSIIHLLLQQLLVTHQPKVSTMYMSF